LRFESIFRYALDRPDACERRTRFLVGVRLIATGWADSGESMSSKRFCQISLIVFALCGTVSDAWAQGTAAKALPFTCPSTALARTDCLIRAALDDLARTYKSVGGGISEIKQLSTYAYRISIVQEERVDQVTYEFGVRPKGVFVILKRSTSTDEP